MQIRPTWRALKLSVIEKKKSGYSMPLYEEFLLRPISHVFSLLFIFLRLPPNAITILSHLLLITGVYLEYEGITYALNVALLLHFVLDCSDGDVARVTKTFSHNGQRLEEFLPTIFLTISFSYLFYCVLGSWSVMVYLFTLVVMKEANFYERLNSEKTKAKSFNVNPIKQVVKLFTSPFGMTLLFSFREPYLIVLLLASFVLRSLLKSYVICK